VGWQIEEFFDPNHVSKQFERQWNKHPKKHLRGLHIKLLHWLLYLIRSDYSPEERQRYWLNTLEHFKGNHAGCPHRDPVPEPRPVILTAAAENGLKKILEDTLLLLTRTRTRFDSQMC
jgi:hypothetical protein